MPLVRLGDCYALTAIAASGFLAIIQINLRQRRSIYCFHRAAKHGRVKIFPMKNENYKSRKQMIKHKKKENKKKDYEGFGKAAYGKRKSCS